MKIKNLLDGSVTSNARSVLLVGASGQMKTITASLFPQPQLWIASNPGPLCGFPQVVWEKLKKQSDSFVIKASPKSGFCYEDAYQFLDEHAEDFATIIIDDVTYLQHALMEEIQLKNRHTRPTQDDWGTMLTRTRNMAYRALESGAHVVMIALEQIIKDEDSGAMYGLPLVSGKFAHDLPALVRTALHITSQPRMKREPERVVHSRPSTVWTWCKDREGLLDPVEPHPDWVVKFLQSKKEEGE